ncbi:hypothetical protein AA313_de0202079 [Arthrobotrys entomopaga]|nr:hypothetical protein AA313_de0202079 [Arthrobotrys entomopaga]
MPPRKGRPPKTAAASTAASSSGVKKRARPAKPTATARKPSPEKTANHPKQATTLSKTTESSTKQPKASISKQGRACPTCGCTCKSTNALSAGWSTAELDKWRKGITGSYAFRSEKSESQWDCIDEMYLKLSLEARSNTIQVDYHSGFLEGTFQIYFSPTKLKPNKPMRFTWSGYDPLEISEETRGHGELATDENFEVKGFFADMEWDKLEFKGAKGIQNRDYNPSFDDIDDSSEEVEGYESTDDGSDGDSDDDFEV